MKLEEHVTACFDWLMCCSHTSFFSVLFHRGTNSLGKNLTRAVLASGNPSRRLLTRCETFDRLVTDHSLFDGICPGEITVHSAAKLQSMWRDVHRAFSKAEARNKVSGDHSRFWEYCRGDKSVMYLHLWCEHRGAGHEFCAGCVYEEDEDDSTKEGDDKNGTPKNNRKRQKSVDPLSHLTEVPTKLTEAETTTKGDLIAEQTALARVQRERIERDQKAEKLSTIDGILVRHRRALAVVEDQIHDRNSRGMSIDLLMEEKVRLKMLVEIDEAGYAVLDSDGENDDGAGWDSDELTGAGESHLGLDDDAPPLPELLFEDSLIEAVGGVGHISAGTVPRDLLNEMARTRWSPLVKQLPYDYLMEPYESRPPNSMQEDYPRLYDGEYGPTERALTAAFTPSGAFFYFLQPTLWEDIAETSNIYFTEKMNERVEGQYNKQVARTTDESTDEGVGSIDDPGRASNC